MAKAVKMQDKKNYLERKKMNTSGEYEGRESSEMSKILAIKHDLAKGYYVSPIKVKMLEDFNKNKMVEKI